MRCLNCLTPNISPSALKCPVCDSTFAELYRLYSVFPPGRTLAGGEYQIKEVLGKGGFGVTYKAYSRGFDGDVAIKECFPQDHARRDGETGYLTHRTSEDQEPYERWLNRFKREGRVLFQLNHPNIVRVLNLFEENNTVYLVMKLLEGQTLKDELEEAKGKGQPLEISRVIKIMDAVVSALSEAHHQDPPLYHLDLSPDNIMMTSDGQIVLIDFGAARRETTESSTIARKESYAPPELMIAGDIGSHTDIFELGMILHELLTGELPPGSLSRVLGKSKEWQPRLEEPWQAIVSAALRLEAEERPRNVSAWWGRYHRWQVERDRVDADREEEQRRKTAEAEEKRRIEEAKRLREAQEELKRKQREFESAEKRRQADAKKNIVEAYPSVSPRASASWTRRKVLMAMGVSFGGTVFWAALSNRENSSEVSNSSGGKVTSERPSGLERFSFETVRLDAQGKIVDRSQETADYFKETGIKLDMVWIPGGRFTMGSPSGELGRIDNEGPQHEVNVPGFFLGKYAVTQAQWEAVMGSNPSYFKGANRPVEQVSWEDAQEFCIKLSIQTGRTYRLPSEAEWEYACRAGTTTPFYFGETISTDVVNYRGQDFENEGETISGKYGSGEYGEFRETTTPVDQFNLANAFGLVDMHGNVWEWCQDRWHDNYNGAPTDGSAWETGNNEERILRGGSWFDNPASCRSVHRVWGKPGDGFSYDGFRLALSASGTS